ncbi:MAG: aspartate-semialdehyde dehydrogenase [Chloroflexi bacterium]|nr:aspartate-semialdehyde dehydrogenase [Chloroflexota bacterium]
MGSSIGQSPERPVRVGILGATGAVGQRFIQLLEANPWFEITAVAASERSVGQRYGDACTWRLSVDCPATVRDLIVQPCEPDLDCELVFSALPSATAREVEERFADAGYGVLSNASAHRMDPDVPLLIPEVNADHLGLIAIQRERRGWDKGFIVTDPNCSTVGAVLALKPLHDAFGLRRAVITTMQALSGAGYPGVPSLDILDNVIPYIAGEEDKLVKEPLKLLGTFSAREGRVIPADIRISPACNRVATRDGHLETISVELERPATVAEAVEALRAFRSLPYELGCPSAVEPTIIVREEVDRPQTRIDRDAGHGMAITVGRIRPCEVLDLKFVVLSHNTIRGAAGGSILNAELMIARGMLS